MNFVPSFRDLIERPHALDAEQALLGAVLCNPDALDRVRSLLEPEDFSEHLHALIYRVLCEQRDQGGTIDLRLIRLALADQDLGVGGMTVSQYVARLCAEATTVMNAPDYARAIRHAAGMRRVVDVSQEALAAMTVGNVFDPADHAASMIEQLDAVTTATQDEHLKRITLAEAGASVLKHVRAARAGKSERGAPFGLPKLDQATLGMAKGDLVIIAGRPGMGKTTKALHVALSSAKAGYGVGFISLEMTGQQLAERALSNLVYSPCGEVITYRAIKEATYLTDEAIRRLEEAQKRVQSLPFWIEQQPGLTVSQIGARARQMATRAERLGQKLSVLIVDHIGLVLPSTRYAGNRVQEITEITSALKVLAKQLGITVLALSQLSRAVELRPDKRPILSDLRDSGSIEQDADMVLGLYREAYYLEHKEHKTPEEKALLAQLRDQLEVEILKQRQGPTLRIKCFCDIACNVIGELAL